MLGATQTKATSSILHANDSIHKDIYVQFIANGKYGICINTMDDILIPAQYDYISPDVYDVNLFLARKNGKYGYVDFESSTVIPFQYTVATEFKEGLAAVMRDNGGFGYMSPYQEMIINPSDIWTDVSLFNDGEAWVKVDDKDCYIIDRKRNYLHKEPFSQIEYVGNHSYKVAIISDEPTGEVRTGIFTVGKPVEWDDKE